MTLRRILCVLILEVCLNCSMASDLKSNPHIDNWMIESYKSCLKAQAELGNIMIDVSTGGVEDNLIDRYAVRFSFFPDMPVFFVSVKLLKPYPDGAGFFCRLNMKNNAVIYALYYEGDPGSKLNIERSFGEHDPMPGISADEIYAQRDKEVVVKFKLVDFIKYLEN